MEVIHFNSQKERLKYLRGGFEEIKPIEVSTEPKKAVQKATDSVEGKSVKKSRKGKKKDDKVQAE